ncbi:hypothetical protein CMV_026051 [Castanea mollissima]|uniref:DNA helicase n=1 Tax=Castanea mollissima TaxID=60419 RepID=A0A8J4QE41_9ROSI|nr:hypothetical protein CMV_026051 [Castanea mollissima]
MVNDVSIPTSTDDASASSEGGAAYDADDARPTFVWGENVNEAIYRFLKHEIAIKRDYDQKMRNLNPSGQITEPKICLKEECQARDSMTLVHNRSSIYERKLYRI